MNFCCQLADIQPMILTMGGLVLSWGFSGTFCGWVNMPWRRPSTTAADKAAKELGGDDNDSVWRELGVVVAGRTKPG
jgi:hypothetical protein